MTRSVLVVDDDAPIRIGMVALLRRRGHHVSAAATVAEAASHLDAQTPTHLLLDLNLPDGNGGEILRRVRAAALPVRVAVVTGSSELGMLDEVRTLGADAVFIKPPDWDKLLAWIAQC